MIWTLPDKKSYFFDTIDSAATASQTFNGHDVYLGVGIAKEAVAQTKRGKSNNILAMPALVADIDVDAKGVASKKPRFKNREAALEFVSSLPLQPTIVVWSGGGLHLYFCFNEPFEINTPQDSVEILNLSKGWNGFLQKEALKLGVSIDSVWDMTRVLRVPGTMNHKTSEARPVEVLELNAETRYNPDDFENYLTYDKSDYGVVVPSKTFGSLVLSAEAQPPARKLEALLANNSDFEEAYRRTRKVGDQSASAYDMALANYTAIAGWTPQEICNLLIYSRSRHGDDLKLREDYMSNTIAKAMQPRELNENVKVAEELFDKAKEQKKNKWDKVTIDKDKDKEEFSAAIASLQELLNLPVIEFNQYGQSQFATYSVKFIDESVDQFPSVVNFYSQKTWLTLADARGAEDRPPLKSKEWTRVKSLIKAVLNLTLDADYENRTKTIRWIKTFAGGQILTANDGGDPNLPFIHHDKYFLRLTPLLNFVKRTREVPATFTPQQLGALLEELGFKTLNTTTPLNKARCRYKVCEVKDLLDLKTPI